MIGKAGGSSVEEARVGLWITKPWVRTFYDQRVVSLGVILCLNCLVYPSALGTVNDMRPILSSCLILVVWYCHWDCCVKQKLKLAVMVFIPVEVIVSTLNGLGWSLSHAKIRVIFLGPQMSGNVSNVCWGPMHHKDSNHLLN